MNNKDEKVIEEFGEEWTKFNYSSVDAEKLNEEFQRWFNIFPWDRFVTRLEQRFSKSEITEMLINSGCKDIKSSSNTPFWCCVGFKK